MTREAVKLLVDGEPRHVLRDEEGWFYSDDDFRGRQLEDPHTGEILCIEQREPAKDRPRAWRYRIEPCRTQPAEGP